MLSMMKALKNELIPVMSPRPMLQKFMQPLPIILSSQTEHGPVEVGRPVRLGRLGQDVGVVTVTW